MAIKYKIDVLNELKKKGYSTYRIRKENLIYESALQLLRHQKPVSWDVINRVCLLLECQISDILVVEKEERE